MNKLNIDNLSESTKFLLSDYPSPFYASLPDSDVNLRWRTVEHYLLASTTNDVQLIEKIRNATTVSKARELVPNAKPNQDALIIATNAKFNYNADLLNKLISIASNKIITGSNSILVDTIRDILRNSKQKMISSVREVTEGILTNLVTRLSAQGFFMMDIHVSESKIISFWLDNNKPIPPDAKNVYTNMGELKSLFSPEKKLLAYLNGRKNVEEEQQEQATLISAILDIQLDKFSETTMNKLVQLKLKGQSKFDAYFLVAEVKESVYNRIMRKLSPYNRISIYNPSFLMLRPTQHLLCPVVEKVQDPLSIADPEKLQTIYASDVMCMEIGLKVGDIILVKDFSPHYRLVI
jgi:hypothetical protein